MGLGLSLADKAGIDELEARLFSHYNVKSALIERQVQDGRAADDQPPSPSQVVH